MADFVIDNSVVMAGVVADSLDPETGKPGKFVIGMQERPLNDLNASCKKIV